MTRRSHAATAITSLVTERDWQRQVTDAAELYGWRTPVSGPLGAGFPDLILCRGDRLILAELKAQDGRLTPDQRHVLDLLGQAAPVYTWRPSDLPQVLDVLR